MPSYLLITLILLFSTLIFLLLFTNIKFFININMKREKSTPFECGFTPKSSPRLPFSLQFFIISLIFLIFDIEISIILPINYMININYMIFEKLIIMIYFLTILLFGTLMEWFEGSLNWIK